MSIFRNLFKSTADQNEENKNESAEQNIEKISIDPSADEEMRNAIEHVNLTGEAEEYVNIGLEYLNGNHVNKNPDEALRCFIIAADMGDVDGAFWAGYYTFDANSNDARDEAARYFKIAARQGHLDAMYLLGKLYVDYGYGWGAGKGYDWWEKAGKLGHPGAQAGMGIAYGKGVGYTDKADHRKACFWCVCAYLQNNDAAKREAAEYLNWARRNVGGMDNYIDSLMESIPKQYPQYLGH